MSETSKAHKEKAPKHFGFAIITISTSRYSDAESGKHVKDETGDYIAKTLQINGHAVVSRQLISDNKNAIEKTVRQMLQSPEIDVIITCGGTGINPSDITIETIEPILDKKLPGFGEIFRRLSYEQIGSAAVMTRAVAGVANGKAIFCLPGSPQAAKVCLETLILPETGHVILHPWKIGI